MVMRHVLYVESPNDEHVCYALCEHYAVPETFTVQAKKGLGDILKTLRVELKKEDEDRLSTIGIVVDADDNPDARWRELVRIFQRAGYTNLPEHPDAAGTVIVQTDRPALGIWMMPDNQRSGELEDFIAGLVPIDDGLWSHAGAVLQQLPERRFRDDDGRKAQVHTWLAWQAEPGRPMGHAIGRGYLDPTAPSAAQFVAWVRRVFAMPDDTPPQA